jgi:hypothetical protein
VCTSLSFKILPVTADSLEERSEGLPSSHLGLPYPKAPVTVLKVDVREEKIRLSAVQSALGRSDGGSKVIMNRPHSNPSFLQHCLRVGLPAGATAPYFTFDPQTSLFTLNAQASNYDVNTVASPVKVYLNNDLLSLFGALDSVLYRNPVDEMDRQILITKQLDSSNVANGIIRFQQEYPTLISWVGFTSLVITSGTIPIESEGIPTSLPFFSNNNVQLTGEPSFLNIVSDFDALLTEGIHYW